MSKLRRKYELENRIEQYITDINKEISTLESEFTFISEEDGEIKSRVCYSEPIIGSACVRLKFYDSFLLEGEELDRFFAYIDNIRNEIKGLKNS